MKKLSLLLIATLFVCLSVLATRVSIAAIVDPCRSSATAPAGVLFVCPQKDGPSLGDWNLAVLVEVRDALNVPIPGVPAADIWLIGCNNTLTLCHGSDAISADAPTDVNGRTTISGRYAAGRCDANGLRAVVQGVVIDAGICNVPCLPIRVHSVDIDGNMAVNVADFAAFGAGYASPPQPYNECLDFAPSFAMVNLADLVKFAEHYSHVCLP